MLAIHSPSQQKKKREVDTGLSCKHQIIINITKLLIKLNTVNSSGKPHGLKASVILGKYFLNISSDDHINPKRDGQTLLLEKAMLPAIVEISSLHIL